MGDILFLAHRVPFPPDRGDKIRSANLLRKLSRLGQVHVGCFAEGAEDLAGLKELNLLAASKFIVRRSKPLALAGAEAVLRGKPVSLTAFHSAKLAGWVRQTVTEKEIDTIFVFSGQMGQYVPDDFGGKVIVDLCDVDSAKFEGYASSGERVWLNEREGRLLALEEDRLARRADATLLISENETALLRSRLSDKQRVNLVTIGNGIDAVFFDPAAISPDPRIQSRSGPHLVFTGQMDYPPNEAAARWTIDKLLPALRARYGSAEFHVVGRNPTKGLLDRDGTPGVTIWGEVPDVRPFIAAADCVIAPLRIARGVQNKVLEAMAMARPVLLTSQAATGIEARNGEHWLVADAEPEAMVEKIGALLRSPDTATQIGSGARRFVLKNHDWDAKLAPLDGLVAGSRQEAQDAA